MENYGKVVRILPLLQNICLHCFISFWLKSWEWNHVTIFNVHTTFMKVMLYPNQYTTYFIMIWYNNSKQNCEQLIEVLDIWSLDNNPSPLLGSGVQKPLHCGDFLGHPLCFNIKISKIICETFNSPFSKSIALMFHHFTFVWFVQHLPSVRNVC